MHLDRCLPSKRVNDWFANLEVKAPTMDEVSDFVDDELNGCVDVKAAHAHV
jgi:hypothetical protein